MNEQMEKFEYNPQKAMQLLEQAGWSKGEDGIYQKEGERLQFCIHNSQGDQVRIDMSNICAQQLGEIGADVCVKVDAQVDWAGQDAYLIGWGSPFDPDDHTYKVFGTQKGANYSGYSNEQVDFLLLSAGRQRIESSESSSMPSSSRLFQRICPILFSPMWMPSM